MDTACASNTSDAPARDGTDGMHSTRGHRRPEACARASVRPTTVLACAVVLLSLLNGARGDYKPDLSTIPTPPVFVHDTVADKLYFQVNSVHEQHDQHHIDYPKDDLHMRCRARAIPEPTYRWQRLIEMDASTQAQCEMMSSTSSRHCWARYDPTEYSSRIYPVAGEGTMHVSMPTQSDEGVYRCLAANGNGTAIDKPINLTMAWIHRFHDKGPESYEVELGNPFDRMCEPPPSNPPPTVYWIFKSEEDRYDQGKADFQSINSTRISGDNSGHLYFHYVTKDDYVPNKYYTCTAWNPETNEYKFGQQFQIIVTTNVRKSLTQVAPTQQKTSKDVETAIKGSMHYLYCFFAGLPEPRPVWYKDGREIMGNDDQYKRISWGKALLIVNVTADDEGVYECRFERAQALDRSFRVEVEAAPYFPNGPPASRNESEGSTVHFECGAMGKPAPEFKFFKNGVPLHNGNGVSISANRLTLTNIQKPDMNGLDGDNGVYQCEATNKHGTVWTNFYLNILSFRPILLRAPSVVNAVMQSDVTLECEFFGSPTPTVTWKRLDGQPMSVYEEEPIDGNNVAKLHIRGVSDSSSGSYECFASNVHGEARGELRLRVLRATRIVGQSASTTKLRNQTRIAGQSVHLPCKVKHDDNLPLRIEWLSDGRPLPQQHIESGHLHILHDNTLVIRESRRYDTGSYTCVASTDLDKAERTFTLTIKDVPSMPSGVSVECAGGSVRTAAISVHYVEPVAIPAPIQEFWVQYRLANTENDGHGPYYGWTTHEEAARAPWSADVEAIDPVTQMRSIMPNVVVDLPSWGTYEFRVIGRNEVGDSAPSVLRSTCTTPAARPEANPVGVVVESDASNADGNLLVKWRPMPRDEWNGPNFGYVVKYRPEGSEKWEEKEVDDPRADHVVIDDDDIATYQPYEVSVKAKNELGEAQIDPLTHRGFSGQGKPLVAPSGFQHLSSDSGKAATFKWNPVERDSVHGDLKGYKIYHWHEDTPDVSTAAPSLFRRRKRQSSERKVAVFGPDATSGAVTDLKPNAVNHATIVVFNDAHESPESEPISFDMPEGSPESVRQLRVFPQDDKSATLVWDPPREPNGVIQAYDVKTCQVNHDDPNHRQLNMNTCKTVSVTPDPDDVRTQIKVHKLQPNSHYGFEVVARTSANEPGDKNVVYAHTLPTSAAMSKEDPYAPKVEIVAVGDDHFNVTRIPGPYDPNDERPSGTTGFFKYREKGDGDDAWVVVHPRDEELLSTSVKGLSPGTQYEVVAVSRVTLDDGTQREKPSLPAYVKTAGQSATAMVWWWLIVLILLICLLICILCVVCACVRSRGANYPVSEKERDQGREPMLKADDKHFGEYGQAPGGERASLASKAESDVDSMADYGDGDAGKFTEDGSFIGQYTQNKLYVTAPTLPADAKPGAPSTFV